MTSIKDREFFFRKLCTNPVFLLKNLTSLIYKVGRYFLNKINIKLTSRHRGLKKTAPWIKNIRSVARGIVTSPPSCFSLPVYPAANVAELIKPQVMSKGLQDDPEGYLKESRWGFLVESILVDCSDLHNNQTKVLDWIQSHTDKNDDAWETYSTCERVSNLLVYLSVIRSSPVRLAFERKTMAFIIDSANWIYQHIEYYGSDTTNNHIINNARALLIAGAALGNELFCRAGLKIFRECLPVMVGEHGFLRERSAHYQLIVSSWVLDAWRFAEAHYGTNHLDSKFLLDYGQRMINATAFFCNTDGRLLGLVGDISPDTSPIHSALRLSRLYSEYWPVTDVSYPATVLKDDWFRMDGASQSVFGNFPVGIFPPKFPTHGHSDYTGFVWIKDGVEILADIGRYRYTPDAVSLFQKSALGHNVLLVDGFSPLCESLVENGQWWPQPYATANLVSWVSNSAVHLSHDGFSRATNVLRHTRTIALGETGLEVVDSLEGCGDAMIRLRWNFGASFDVFDSALMVVKGGGSVVEFSTKGFAVTPLVESCSGQLGGGWISTVYGEVVPSISVDVSGSVKLPIVISTCFETIKCAG